MGLLQPLPISAQVLEEQTKDFITHFTNSFDHTVIWVVCDRHTKFVHFIAFPTNFFAEDLATIFPLRFIYSMGSLSPSFQTETPFFSANFGRTTKQKLSTIH
jgi:hypothetical protein